MLNRLWNKIGIVNAITIFFGIFFILYFATLIYFASNPKPPSPIYNTTAKVLNVSFYRPMKPYKRCDSIRVTFENVGQLSRSFYRRDGDPDIVVGKIYDIEYQGNYLNKWFERR